MFESIRNFPISERARRLDRSPSEKSRVPPPVAVTMHRGNDCPRGIKPSRGLSFVIRKKNTARGSNYKLAEFNLVDAERAPASQRFRAQLSRRACYNDGIVSKRASSCLQTTNACLPPTVYYTLLHSLPFQEIDCSGSIVKMNENYDPLIVFDALKS